MQNTGAGFYSLFAVISFFAAVCLRLSMLLFDLSLFANYFYYLIVFSGIVFIGIECFKRKQYASAFVFENVFHLSFFSYVASLGFFADFIHQCVKIFFSIENESNKNFTYFIPVCFICLTALLSSFYFVNVGMSFSDKNYDFREFKLFHMIPVVWALFHIIVNLSEAVRFSRDIDDIIKYLVLIFSVCFFYCFASEIDNKNGAKRKTVFFTESFSFCSILFFINRLMLLLGKTVPLNDSDGVFALSCFLINGFVFFFSKNIISHSKTV